jgi:lipoprotein NlpD
MVNKGINIRPGSDRQVVASRSGQVVFYHDNFKGFGKTVILEHPGDFMTVYAGLRQVFVKIGESITQGSVIARVHSTAGGKNNYLHFEIRKGHQAQNPIFYLPS